MLEGRSISFTVRSLCVAWLCVATNLLCAHSVKAEPYLWHVILRSQNPHAVFIFDQNMGGLHPSLLVIETTFAPTFNWAHFLADCAYVTKDALRVVRYLPDGTTKVEAVISGDGIEIRAGTVLPNGDLILITSRGVELLAHDHPTKSQIIMRAGVPTLLPGGQSVHINPTTIASSSRNDIFVGAEISGVGGRHGVWRLSRTENKRWNVQLVAQGASPPALTTGLSGNAVLLNDVARSFVATVEGGAGLKIRNLDRSLFDVFPGPVSPRIRFISEDEQGALLISEEGNNRIWRLSPNGIVPIAGSGQKHTSNDQWWSLHTALSVGLTPTRIQAAAHGGLFTLNNNRELNFVGPDDELERQLGELVRQADWAVRWGDLETARPLIAQIAALSPPKPDSSLLVMKQWRVQIALQTLKHHIGAKTYGKIKPRRPKRGWCG